MYANFIARQKNNNVKATEIVDLMQRENNRILSGSIIIINNYFDSRCYERYCSQLQATPSACCNISHSNDYLSNYLLNIPIVEVPCMCFEFAFCSEGVVVVVVFHVNDNKG